MSSSQRLARPLTRQESASMWWRALLGMVFIIFACGLLARRMGVEALTAWLLPAIGFVTALVLVWSPLESAVQGDPRRPDVVSLFSKDAWARVLSGVVLAGASVWWLAQWDFDDRPLVRAIVVPSVVVLGFVLVLAPWWMRLLRQVGVEREQRVREFERAEIAAHLHDSVLQTLTLIRARAHEPDVVAKLARAQERDLRAYLYQERKSEDESVAVALAAAMSQVEDDHGVAIDMVTVGDGETSATMRAAVRAAREAAQNAARHGREPISVYAEISANQFEVFVRDSGPGFDPTTVDPDRAGIRHSIIGRVVRHGGRATVVSAPGGRTEVHIVVPRRDEQ